MSQYYNMHPENPQKRLLEKATEAIRKGALIAYPTDSGYALGCKLDNKEGCQKILNLRQFAPSHPMSLVCATISQASHYAFLENHAFNVLKKLTPGLYTFILPASKRVPRLMHGGKRKTVGIRIPDSAIALGLVETLGEPILSTSLWLDEEKKNQICPQSIFKQTANQVELVLDGGEIENQPTSIWDLTQHPPKLIRQGAGQVDLSEI